MRVKQISTVGEVVVVPQREEPFVVATFTNSGDYLYYVMLSGGTANLYSAFRP